MRTEEGIQDSLGARAAALLCGLLGYAAFFGLGETIPGLTITYLPSFSNSSPGELYFWLGHTFLLFPAAALIGWGLSPWAGEALAAGKRSVAALSPRNVTVCLVALTVVALVWSRLGHRLFLLDLPFTDDEYAARFGGQVLAMGRLKVPALQPFEAMPSFFLLSKDGFVFARDWLGAQLPWALAEWTGLGALVFSALAVVPIPCVAYVLSRRFGRFWGLAGAAAFFLSPMAFALSMTSHTHVVSRGLLALWLALSVYARDKGRLAPWSFAGLALGLGLITRPPEIGFLVLPFLVDHALRALRREEGAARELWGLALGAAGPLALLFLHNWALSGHPFASYRIGELQAFLGQTTGTDSAGKSMLWTRFGNNLSYNLLLLCVWFLGPLGVLAVPFGILRERFTRLLASGVGLLLLAGLLHQNYGIHPVGPIHYSECAVPLTLLAVYGLKRLVSGEGWLRLDARTAGACAAVILVMGLGTFDLWNAFGLRRQAEVQQRVYGGLESAGLKNAVVLAPQFAQVWLANPASYETGSWVFEWRRPRPDFSDDILILNALEPALPALRAAFPNRPFYVLGPLKTPPYLQLVPLQ